MKKRLGQHFLTDPSILRRVVQFAHLDPEDTVVEIGPGAGSLTLALAAVVHRLIAIEIDRDLIAKLRARVPSNVEIIEGDALEVAFPQAPFHVVANLPYNIATPLLKRFIDHRDQIIDVTVTGFVHEAFSSSRQKLANNLQLMFGTLSRSQIVQRLERAGINANARPEELSVTEFLRVYNQFRS